MNAQATATRAIDEDRIERCSALTPRELDVLKLSAKGFDVAGVAERLGIAPDTVKDYRKFIRLRLGVDTMIEAAVIGAKARIL